MMMSLREAAQAVNGTLSGDFAGADLCFASVSTDSRAAGPGVLFIALIGERFDAHDFVAEVAAKGAVAALVAADQLDRLRACRLPLIAVANTRLALGQLAAAWRQRFSIPVIAVTGSNGKTTTKEMIAAILRAQAALDGQADPASAVLATQGNLNNDIGLPLTLLALRETHRYAVVELGMNHPGEIAYLAKIARPNAAVVINALRAHLEGMGSLDAVAREKGSLLAHLAPGGVAVIAADSPFTELWRGLAAGQAMLSFSRCGRGDIKVEAQAENLGSFLSIRDQRPGAAPDDESGVVSIFLQAAGQHNADNAAAAAAVCLAAGCSLRAVNRGLAGFAGVKGRLQQKTTGLGGLLIDDTYNANPDSVRAAIDVLAGLPGAAPRLLVLGDMGETGSAARQYHQEVGAYARQRGIDRLFALGDLSVDAVSAFGPDATHYGSPEALVAELAPVLTPSAAVLVKGSRFMRMERVVALLEKPLEINSAHQGDASCC